MTKLETLVREEQQQMQADTLKAQAVEDYTKMIAFTEIGVMYYTTEPDGYKHYLDIQADNPMFSSMNIILIMTQTEEVSMLRTMQDWAKNNRRVLDGEEGWIIRLEESHANSGRRNAGFRTGRVFDINQTWGAPVVKDLPLVDHTPRMDIALRQMLRMSPVPILTVADSSIDAKYDPHKKEIILSEDLVDTKAFAALAREIFHATTHAQNRMIEYNAGENVLDAESVSYMLCRRYGIPCEYPEVYDISDFYTDMTVKDRSMIIDWMSKSFHSMERAIQKELDPPSQSRINRGQSR